MNILEIVRLLFIYVVALTVHEFSHAWMAHRLGDPTAKGEGRLSLNPFAHIDPFVTLALPFFLILIGSPIIFGAARPVPFNPHMVRGGHRGAALVALAGPASNFLMAAMIALLVRLIPGLGIVGSGFFITFVVTNIALGLFNLIPVPPLDGSRVTYAFAPDSIRDLFDRFERLGMMGILIFFFVIYPLVAGSLQGTIQFVSRYLLGL